jgi:hypothetical protein
MYESGKKDSDNNGRTGRDKSGGQRVYPALIKIIRQKKTKKQKLENVCSIPIICIGSYYTDKR